MISFPEVMQLTSTISSPTAFDTEECFAYYSLAAGLPEHSTILEIGLQFGRSSSIVLQVAKDQGHTYYGVDPFTDPPEAEVEWKAIRDRIGYSTNLMKYKSEEVPIWPSVVHLALIDGDHSYDAVKRDSGILAPLISRGGYLCYHDYGRDSLPEVYAAVNDFMVGQPFTLINVAGTLGVWRRDI